jgi:hypothetical protein
VTELVTYKSDSVLSARKNPDDTVNEYGVKLLDICLKCYTVKIVLLEIVIMNYITDVIE